MIFCLQLLESFSSSFLDLNMGLRKFLAKNLPGCVGRVAKTQVIVYKQLKAEFPNASENELFKMLIDSRMNAYPTGWQPTDLSDFERLKSIYMCDGKLFQLILAIILFEFPEYNHWRTIKPEVYTEVEEIVMEAIHKYTHWIRKMEFIGWILWIIVFYLAITWTIGVKGFLLMGLGETQINYITIILFWTVFIIFLITDISKLHIFWVAPLSYIIALILPYIF